MYITNQNKGLLYMLDLIIENENGQLVFNFDAVELKTSNDFVSYIKDNFDFSNISKNKIVVVESELILQIMIKSITAYTVFYFSKETGRYHYSELPIYVVDVLAGKSELDGVLYSNV